MLIDDKGRLFGKLNIIDAVVILFVVSFVAGAINMQHNLRKHRPAEYPTIYESEHKRVIEENESLKWELEDMKTRRDSLFKRFPRVKRYY